MRRLILTGMALAIASLGVAQESLVSRNPVQTVGGYSAHRYVSEPATLPPAGGGDSVIPLCETKRVLDELVEEVYVTVIHEIAHAAGIDDDRLHELGWA